MTVVELRCDSHFTPWCEYYTGYVRSRPSTFSWKIDCVGFSDWSLGSCIFEAAVWVLIGIFGPCRLWLVRGTWPVPECYINTILISIQTYRIIRDERICVPLPGEMFCRNRLATSEAECISGSHAVTVYENRSAPRSVGRAATERYMYT